MSSAELHRVETSLKEYLIEAQMQGTSGKALPLHRYNNLKVTVDKARFPFPHFMVNIGISSVVFTMEACEKIYGGIPTDEKYIQRWYMRSSAKATLEEYWQVLVTDKRKEQNIID